eukprot:TRINITY_DN14849_c0_g1_i1.p1 TRINITY_DN14849_c0_g1~~TRINITY_DN14849_c0_g1_i1.p1  ORF type:complete len:246 (-),score=31.52 TRINITY_DN14849_c0_g1_i1:149-886(-)
MVAVELIAPPVAVFAVFVLWLLAIFVSGNGPLPVKSALSRLVRLFKKRKGWNWTFIDAGLYLGCVPRHPSQIEELRKEGVGAIVTMTERWEMKKLPPAGIKDCGVELLHCPTPDFFAPTQEDIAKAVAFMKQNIDSGSSVYVHCNGGRGRSAVCIICFLIAHRGKSAEEAFELVISKRQIASMTSSCRGCIVHKQWKAIKRFERKIKADSVGIDIVEADKGKSGTVVPVQDNIQNVVGVAENALS